MLSGDEEIGKEAKIMMTAPLKALGLHRGRLEHGGGERWWQQVAAGPQQP